MTAAGPTTGTTSPAWQAYAAEERRLRDEYVTAVRTARQVYNAATAPARAAYDQAERAAWQLYFHAGRWNWRTYTAKLDMDPVQVTAAGPAATPPAADAGSTCGCQVPRPRPTFTPNPETEE